MNVELNATLYQNIKRLVDIIEKKTKRKLDDTALDDLCLAEIKILDAIGMEGEKTIKEIAEYLNVALSTPTKTMDRLVSKGYIIRETGVDDRRLVISRLTDHGKNALLLISQTRQDNIMNLLNVLTDEEQNQLNKIIQTILTSE